MSNRNFFGDDQEEESFYDFVDDPHAPAPSVRIQPQASPAPEATTNNFIGYSEPARESNYEEAEEDEDYTAVLSDARLRLEQGRLYEMIMNHNLFEGADADEKAIKNVTREIRNFAKERMEVMLGMRQESKEVQAVSVELPFNDLEIRTLKALAFTATKGKTETPEEQEKVYEAPAVRKTTLKPIGLGNSGKNTLQKASLTKPVQKQPKPLQQQPKAPVKRTAKNELVEKILAEEGLTLDQVNQVFPPEYVPLQKPIEQMTDDEKIARNKQVAKVAGSTKKADSPFKIPMPSLDQENMMHSTRAMEAGANPQMQTIMSLLTNKK